MSELRWTDERCQQFNALRQCVSLARGLNKGSHICEKIKEIEELAEEFDGKLDSFTEFLRQLAVEDRTQHNDSSQARRL
jgi:hypothetical protein